MLGQSVGVLEASEQRENARRVALDVARRTADPERIAAALAAAPAQTNHPKSVHWRAYEVAGGDAGLALLCAYLDACVPDEGWDALGHGFVTAAARGATHAPRLGAGLFSGLSGVCFAAESLSRDGTRYQRLLATLDRRLAPRVSALGRTLREREAPGGVSDFDVISGASGIGAYLLRRDPYGALPEVLRGLTALAAPVDGPPRWFTPPTFLFDETAERMYPAGNMNCGLAHGIPGPLALLALALSEGHEVAQQAEAVRLLAEWLAAHRVDDEWGVNWPSAVPLPVPGSPASPARLRPTRSAWCYGSPGIARALWLAGDALGDASMRELAIEALLAVRRRPLEERYIDSPTFCHGVSGLLQIVLRFAADTGLPAFSAMAAELVDQVLAAYEPQRPLGYASIEPGDNPVDRAGLLDGAAGIAMVLLAASTGVEPTWDRLFLLS